MSRSIRICSYLLLPLIYLLVNVKLAQLKVAQCYSACQWAEQGVLTLPTGV